jgi:hypothetical protein
MLLSLLAGAGPWAAFLGLAGFVVLAMLSGRLIPRREHERALRAEEKRGDGWHDAYMAEVARGDIRDQQLNEILTFVRRSPTKEAS